jgi:hypothetical protein
MYRFKKSLIALIGVLTLAGIATISLPHIGRGASGTTNNAPTSQTQNVNVVNTPTVNAQQGGTWNVGINGTPAVTVSNFPATTNVAIDASANAVRVDTTNPLLVRGADNPARQPFEASTAVIINDGSISGDAQFVYTVPVGKVFVLEEVAAEARLTNQTLVDFGVRGSAGPLHRLLVNEQRTDWIGKNNFVVSQHVRLYFNEGDQITCHAERNSTQGSVGVDCSVSGYFIDK